MEPTKTLPIGRPDLDRIVQDLQAENARLRAAELPPLPEGLNLPCKVALALDGSDKWMVLDRQGKELLTMNIRKQADWICTALNEAWRKG